MQGSRWQDIDFKGEALVIVQQKTGAKLKLLLVKEVKLAIEDYFAARPRSEAKEIFLTACAPYTGSMRHAMRKNISKAGVNVRERKTGPHSLRSSPASSMVNDSVPYETVRRILGHSSENY